MLNEKIDEANLYDFALKGSNQVNLNENPEFADYLEKTIKKLEKKPLRLSV